MATIDEKIVLGLDIPKTARQINADIKKLQTKLAQIKLTGALDSSAVVKQINGQIAKLQAQLKKITLPVDSSPVNSLTADIKTLAAHLKSLSLENTTLAHVRTDIDGVQVSLDSLIHKLSAIDKTTDLTALRSQADALKAAFSELARVNGISVDDKLAPLATINTIINSIAAAKDLG